MRHWLENEIIARGRLPLLFFFLGFIAGFLFIRFSVRMIRADVRWWPGNVTPGGQHVHHVVFGVVAMIASGGAMIATYEDGTQVSGAVLAACFGVGAALVLDEFALIFYLKDVYWSEQGRASVDAVFVALAVTGLLLLGARPDAIVNPTDFRDNPEPWVRAVLVLSSLLSLAIAAVVIAKGKIWTGLFGLFFSPMLLVGAIRLSRPGAPWARWRYRDKPKKMARAITREKRYRRPIVRAKIYVQDLVAGKPSVEHARLATEAELERTVQPAPPSLHGAHVRH
ncbi:integral membrane protein [Rhodococcus olei]|uniref:Integral membrane protein n=1 Tax=Rhodococcus olei TaxID=2161675 RepID=A0ABP8NWI3_9NOCA